MSRPLELHEDRLFPAEPGVRALARELYATVAQLWPGYTELLPLLR